MRLILMLLLVLLASLVVLGSSLSINFEDLPDNHFFGLTAENIGTLYSGIGFGPGVTGLSVTRFGGYANAAFPPHSGDVVVWSAFDFDTTITFAAPQSMVGIWYTSLDFLTLTAFDASNFSLGSVTGNPNTDGSTGVSDFLSISATGISSVVISGQPSLFVFDDLTYEASAPSAIPEARTWWFCLVMLVVLLVRQRGRRIVR